MEKKAAENLDANRKKLDKLAEALMEEETLEKEEIDQLLDSDNRD